MADIPFIDSFKNLVSALGTSRDKAASGEYFTPELTDGQLIDAYRGSWLPRKIIEIPAKDATRKWRHWKGDKEQVAALEAEEERLDLQSKTQEAIIKARLFGGAGIYISIKGETDPSLPLDPETVKEGGVDFLTVLPRRVLTAGEIESDPASRQYGKPMYYTISSGERGHMRIHPTRIAAFIGKEPPDPELQGTNNKGWGDSVLLSVYSAVKNADSTMANVASLVYEAKVDVLGVPGLAQIMADKEQRKLFIERAELSAQLKGNNGMFLRDAEETYDSKSFSFSNLDSIANLQLQAAAGAGDIPLTRLLGSSPGGMNATGESDIRNYYDHVQSLQSNDIGPRLAILDDCLVRSALGSNPGEIYYEWSSLWQTTEKERVDNGKTAADTIKVLADTRLFEEAALSRAAETLLTESGVMPTIGTLEDGDDEV